ncbi:MAG: hypothetical protein EOO24_06630 [Comamonadaceae bacterium]|nr:MAG: hypothetical protein EOO24_06630 [Comamonadaceae bacterium]
MRRDNGPGPAFWEKCCDTSNNDRACVHPDLNQKYVDALQAEARAWDAVRNHMPGSGSFDAGLWTAWRRAQKACEQARKAVLAEIAAMSAEDTGKPLRH